MLSYTDDSLFLSPTSYLEAEKIASTTLSRDGDSWEEEIIKELHQSHPYLVTRNIKIFITKSDPENGVGIGSIHLDNKLVIPIIIDRFKLAPLDLMWDENQLLPLTRHSLEKKVQETANGKPTMPGTGEATDVSLYSRMQPPFDGKYSYASFAAEGELPVITRALEKLSDVDREWIARSPSLRSVFSAYVTKTAQATKGKKDDLFTLTPYVDSHKGFQKIASCGVFSIPTDKGLVPGIVFNKIFDVEGNIMDKVGFIAAIDGSGRHTAIMPDQSVMGRPLTTGTVQVSTPAVGDSGIFFKIASGAMICSRPIKLAFASANSSFGAVMDGRTIKIATSKDFQSPTYVDKTLIIPEDWGWLKVASKVVPLTKVLSQGSGPQVRVAFDGHNYGAEVGDAQETGSKECVATFLSDKLGHRAAKLAMASLVNQGDSATFSLAACKVPTLSATVKPINLCKEAMYIVPSAEYWLPLGPRQQRVKIAAVTDDAAKQTVDALLGLNFLNQETLHRFLSKIDLIDTARNEVAKLLLASRMGLDVDSRPLRTAMFALESVSRDLKELRNGAEIEEQEG